MKLVLLFITVTAFILLSDNVSASDPPIQTSPTNNTTVSSSSLKWQTPSYQLYNNDPYRVQVDNDMDFSSTYRDYYTSNTTYTPTLTFGNWYWRVKAKDSSGTWSEWSETWLFTLQENSPTPTILPSLSPTNTPSPTPQTNKFIISNNPSPITSDQSFSIFVDLKDNPNSNFYLKGAFKKANSSNYFGLTKVNSSWVKNGLTFSDQFSITTNSSGNWSGSIEVKPDSEDSGFTGSGDYIFKVAKYSLSGSGPSWSNETGISITAQQNSQPTPTAAITNKPTAYPTDPSITASVSLSPSILGQSTASFKLATPSPSISILSAKSEKNFFILPIIGGGLILVGTGSLIYRFLKFRVKS